MWLYHVNHALGPAIGLYWRLRLSGRVEAIPRTGPPVAVANHASYLDPWLLGMASPRPVHYLITNVWYDRSPAWRALFRAFGTEPVRVDDPHGTLHAVSEVLARGDVAGIARIAARTGAPVLPMGIRGGFESLPRHGRLPRPTRVAVEVGEPLTFPGAPLTHPGPDTLRTFREELFERVRVLAGHEPGATRP